VRHRLPDLGFTGEKTLRVGDKDVVLIEMGPAHTAGDTIVHVPADRTVYTGDILFIDGTPVMWAGPIGNWLKACDRILAMDVETIVPGHGPTTDKTGVRRMQSYLAHIDLETRQRHAAGMKSWDIAQDIALAEFGAWEDAERIAVTVDTIVREIEGDASPRNVPELFTRMATLDKLRNPQRYHSPAAAGCTHHDH
jgi:cyclase